MDPYDSPLRPLIVVPITHSPPFPTKNQREETCAVCLAFLGWCRKGAEGCLDVEKACNRTEHESFRA